MVQTRAQLTSRLQSFDAETERQVEELRSKLRRAGNPDADREAFKRRRSRRVGRAKIQEQFQVQKRKASGRQLRSAEARRAQEASPSVIAARERLRRRDLPRATRDRVDVTGEVITPLAQRPPTRGPKFLEATRERIPTTRRPRDFTGFRDEPVGRITPTAQLTRRRAELERRAVQIQQRERRVQERLSPLFARTERIAQEITQPFTPVGRKRRLEERGPIGRFAQETTRNILNIGTGLSPVALGAGVAAGLQKEALLSDISREAGLQEGVKRERRRARRIGGAQARKEALKPSTIATVALLATPSAVARARAVSPKITDIRVTEARGLTTPKGGEVAAQFQARGLVAGKPARVTGGLLTKAARVAPKKVVTGGRGTALVQIGKKTFQAREVSTGVVRGRTFTQQIRTEVAPLGKIRPLRTTQRAVVGRSQTIAQIGKTRVRGVVSTEFQTGIRTPSIGRIGRAPVTRARPLSVTVGVEKVIPTPAPAVSVRGAQFFRIEGAGATSAARALTGIRRVPISKPPRVRVPKAPRAPRAPRTTGTSLVQVTQPSAPVGPTLQQQATSFAKSSLIGAARIRAAPIARGFVATTPILTPARVGAVPVLEPVRPRTITRQRARQEPRTVVTPAITIPPITIPATKPRQLPATKPSTKPITAPILAQQQFQAPSPVTPRPPVTPLVSIPSGFLTAVPAAPVPPRALPPIVPFFPTLSFGFDKPKPTKKAKAKPVKGFKPSLAAFAFDIRSEKSVKQLEEELRKRRGLGLRPFGKEQINPLRKIGGILR